MTTRTDDELDRIFALFHEDRRSEAPRPLAAWISDHPDLSACFVQWATELQSLTVADLDQASIERERGVLAEKAGQSGKAADIIAKMVEGGLRKFHQEVVLLEQAFVIDGKTKVAKVVDEAAKQVGAPVRIAGFLRFELGEGIEKKSEDFAAEVAAQLKK